MVYTYNVTLEGLNGFRRVYKLNPDTTLYAFHKQMVIDMDFSKDNLTLFKALDKEGRIVARYGTFDLGSGTVDEVSIADTIGKGVASFVYFYDAINKKKVIITLVASDEEAAPVSGPTLVEEGSKGPNPIEFENGYIAYEDLPADQKHLPTDAAWKKKFRDEEEDDESDDDEEEEEDDDDDETKEVFDESEGVNL